MHKRLSTGENSLPGWLVLLQRLIPVFSLFPSKRRRILAKRLVHWPLSDLDQNLEDTEVCQEKRRKGIAAFQRLFMPPGMIKEPEKLFRHVTNKQPSSQSCCIWGPLPERGGRAKKKMSSRQNASFSVPAQPFLPLEHRLSVAPSGGQSCKIFSLSMIC